MSSVAKSNDSKDDPHERVLIDDDNDSYHTSESRKQIGLVSAIFLYALPQSTPWIHSFLGNQL